MASSIPGIVSDKVGCGPDLVIPGETGEIFVALRNPYSRALAGKLEAKLPEGWPAGNALAFSLQPGEQKLVTLSVSIPATAAAKD